jgi:hypothetical protein
MGVTCVEPISDSNDLGSKPGLKEQLFVVHAKRCDEVTEKPKLLQ